MSEYRSALRNPWWIPVFLGGVPDIEPRLISLLGMVSLALFFEQYDISMLTSALKFIAADLGMTERDLGGFLALIRLGALPAFLIMPLADRIGRRRVFLASVLAFSIGTLVTAFARTAVEFIVAQIVARTFMLSGSAVAFVIVTEEYPARYRGWAIGMLGALSACGNGLGAALFAAIDHLPYGWRSLYVIGIVPLALLPRLRRQVSETRRFDRHRASTAIRVAKAWYQPMVDLASAYPGRAMGVAIAGGLLAVGESAVFQFTGYFTQTVHHWSPGQFSAMFIIGGAVGIIGNVVAGRLGDRIGRRAIGFIFLSLFPVFAWIFYHGPGWSLPIAWALFVFCNTAGSVVVRAFSTELFPTSYRGTSAAWLAFIQSVGWGVGLALVGLGTQAPGDIARMTTLVALAVLVAAFALLVLPETRRQELETISHDDDESAPSAILDVGTR